MKDKPYIQQYNKEHYKRFVADLKPDVFDELQKYLKESNLSKPEFIKLALKIIKESN